VQLFGDGGALLEEVIPAKINRVLVFIGDCLNLELEREFS